MFVFYENFLNRIVHEILSFATIIAQFPRSESIKNVEVEFQVDHHAREEKFGA